MANLSADAVRKIIENRPKGVEPEDIVQGLMDAGHNLLSPIGKPAEIPQEKPIESFSFGRTLANIPKSALGVAKGIVSGLVSPLKTTRALLDVGTGAVSAGISGITGEKPSEITEEDVQKFEAVKQMLIDRYGSIGALKKTIEDDPVGFAMDASALLSGGGTALAKTGVMAGKVGGIVSGVQKAGRIGEAAAKTGQAVGTAGKIAEKIGKGATVIGKAIEPINLATSTGRLASQAIAKSTKLPERFYESALKMSTTLSAKERAERVATGLKEGVIPTREGLESLQNKIEAINGEIASKIEQGKNVGMMVSAPEVSKRIDDLIPFFENTIEPQKYIGELEELKKLFSERGNIPIDVAQKIKQNTYTLLRKAYGELKSVSVEGQKAIARGLKEEIVKQFPEIGTLNERESALLNLEKSVERAVGRITNRDIIGIGTPIAGAAGEVVLGKGAGIFSTIAKSLLDSPEIKSKIAIALNKARTGKIVSQKFPIGRQVLFQAGRNQEVQERIPLSERLRREQ